jgi:hypothetical protein
MKLKLLNRILLLYLISSSSFCNKAAFTSKKGTMQETLSSNKRDGPTVITPIAPPIISQIQQSTQDDLPDLPIYFQGWVKYFKYANENTSNRPKTFFKNNMFATQVVKKDSDEVIGF